MPNCPPARAHVEAALRAQATCTAVDLIKDRARAYAKRPMTLENIVPGLSAAAPETIIAVAKRLIAAESNAPRRWFGFGGEVPILNAKAVLLSARALAGTNDDAPDRGRTISEPDLLRRKPKLRQTQSHDRRSL